MKSWKAATIGVAFLVLAPVCMFGVAKLASLAPAGIADKDQGFVKLIPACDYFPKGINGAPCADAEEFARTGRLIFH